MKVITSCVACKEIYYEGISSICKKYDKSLDYYDEGIPIFCYKNELKIPLMIKDENATIEGCLISLHAETKLIFKKKGLILYCGIKILKIICNLLQLLKIFEKFEFEFMPLTVECRKEKELIDSEIKLAMQESDKN